jgi:hypothetical protein
MVQYIILPANSISLFSTVYSCCLVNNYATPLDKGRDKDIISSDIINE